MKTEKICENGMKVSEVLNQIEKLSLNRSRYAIKETKILREQYQKAVFSN